MLTEQDNPANSDRYLVISADCHAGPPLETYRDYLERKHRDAYDDYVAKRRARSASMSGAPLEAFAKSLNMPEETVRAFASHPTLQPGGHPGLRDPARRTADLDAQGIAAEVVFPDFTADNDPPFAVLGGGRKAGSGGMFSRGEGFYDSELVCAGARAYNRWLVDFCSDQPERHAGIAVLPEHDIDASVEEVRWAHRAGLRGGVLLTGMMPGRPGYNDPIYDPIWSVCEELQMPLNTHVGNDLPDYGARPESFALSQTEMLFLAHRPLWFLMWGGVFERHPQLTFVLTEQDCYWVPQTLRELDTVFHSKFAGPGLRLTLSLTPSEYWNRQCYVGATVMSRAEAEARETIGMSRILWGADYPHLESSCPYTEECLRNTFAGLPREDVTRLLGHNAASAYDFDLEKLAPVARRIGPRVESVAAPIDESEIPPDYIGEGFRRPASHEGNRAT